MDNYDNYQHSYSLVAEMTQSDNKPLCSFNIAADLLLPCFNPIINFVNLTSW